MAGDNRLKGSEVRKLMSDGKYKMALKVVEGIDLNRIKDCTDFNIFADTFIKAGQFEKAIDVLLRLYKQYPTRRVIYKLIRVYIKNNQIDEAEAFYKSYVEKYPDSLERWVLRYRIDKMKKEGYDVRIASLEQLKKNEYIEEWAYELAKLYHKAGLREQCINECSDIILWFGEGVIVEKAKMLKAYYTEGVEILSDADKRTNTVSINRVKKEKEKKRKEKKDMLMDTQDLGRQIAELEKQEKVIELRRELVADLQPTTNIQAEIQKDLGLTDGASMDEEIYRLLRVKKEERKKNRLTETDDQEIDLEGTEDINRQGDFQEEEHEPLDQLTMEEELARAARTYIDEGVFSQEPNAEEPVEAEWYIGDGYEETAAEYQEEEYSQEEEQYPEEYSQEEVQYPEEYAEAGYEEPIPEPVLEEYQEEMEISYEDLFGRYMQNENLSVQLVSMAEQFSAAEGPVNYMIYGEEKENTVLLAKQIAKALNQLGRISTPRVAKIRGKNLNGMDLEGNWEKLKNGTLYIEGAGGLYTPSVREIEKMIDSLGQEISVVLTDEPDAGELVMAENPELREYFPYIIKM